MLTKWHPPKPASSPLWPCPRPVLPQLWCKCRETIWDHAKGPQAYSFVWFCQVFTRIFSGYRVTIGLSLPRGCYWHPSFVVALQGRVVQHHPATVRNKVWSLMEDQPQIFSSLQAQRRSDASHMAVCQNLVPLVNIKIAGKWMFIPLKMVLIGIDP